MVLSYKTNKFEGELSSSDEGEVRWMDLEEMKKANEKYAGKEKGELKMVNFDLKEFINTTISGTRNRTERRKSAPKRRRSAADCFFFTRPPPYFWLIAVG